ncbi:MAG: metG, partial [Acidobacteria bacterium]|nr:metG [Acidobacteriota bacterium]
MTRKFYITTAIHYVNDDPHIGHMYENVVADVIARHRRRMGDDVWFLTGTDEHGQKIERSAAKEGILPIELADRVVANHHALWKTLNISHDDFIRTTEARHRVGVLELIRRIQERIPDDIYLGEHSGWYCQSEETFIPENQVKNGKDDSGHAVEWTTEKNFFFKLSRYTQPLLEHYRSHPEFVYPPSRLNEVISFVEQGLKDLSISRTSIKWGIPFPGYPDHVIYVWMEALTNYISALGFGNPGQDGAFERYWPADLQLVGKDIVRFHAVYWPAFLMAAGLALPKQIVGHGWWLRDNQKISKSTGNVVRPYNILEDFGTDSFRYFLLREMVFGQDQNYSDEAFLARYNADLANDLGNTLSRAIKMSDSYFGGKTPPISCPTNELHDIKKEVVPLFLREMEAYNFQRALDQVWRLLVAVNGYIVSREPWKRFKETGPDEALARILWNTLESLRVIWVMLAPFMPVTAAEALSRLGADPTAIDEPALTWGGLPTNAPL